MLRCSPSIPTLIISFKPGVQGEVLRDEIRASLGLRLVYGAFSKPRHHLRSICHRPFPEQAFNITTGVADSRGVEMHATKLGFRPIPNQPVDKT